MVFIEEVVESFPTATPISKNERHFGSTECFHDLTAQNTCRSPFVLWAQDGDNLFLKIDIQDSISPQIKIGERTITVLTEATGASGVRLYRAHIDLLHPVVEEESSFIVLPNHIDVRLSKMSKNDWWARISSDTAKLPWLKIDFDRWKNEDDDDDEDEEDESERLKQSMMSSNYGGESAEGDYAARLTRQLDAAEAKAKMQLKNIYLCLYNAVMFIGFSYIFWRLSYRMYIRGPEVYAESVELVGTPMVVLQILALAEIVHPLLGLVSSSVGQTIIQQWGRSFVLFFVIFAHEGLHEIPHVHWLFFIWSAIEIIRYPFYMLKSTGQDQGKWMTWIRYTAWIPLYPAGMCLEVSIINAAIPLFEMSGKYSLHLPNSWNFSFEYSTFLRAYIMLYPVFGLYMLKHMWDQRKKALRISPLKKATENSKRKSA